MSILYSIEINISKFNGKYDKLNNEARYIQGKGVSMLSDKDKLNSVSEDYDNDELIFKDPLDNLDETYTTCMF